MHITNCDYDYDYLIDFKKLLRKECFIFYFLSNVRYGETRKHVIIVSVRLHVTPHILLR